MNRQAECKRIWERINDILELMVLDEKIRGDLHLDPINWGGVSCSEVAYVQTHEGEEYYQATIDEASPSCERLPAYFSREIETDLNLIVICEW